MLSSLLSEVNFSVALCFDKCSPKVAVLTVKASLYNGFSHDGQ